MEHIQALDKEYSAIASAQDKQEEEFLAKGNVVGVAVGNKMKNGKETGDSCLSVLVNSKMDRDLLSSDDVIPSTVGKYKTDIVEVGDIFAGGVCCHQGNTATAQETDTMMHSMVQEDVSIQKLATRLRPVEGGYSVGHYQITAGTMATAVVDSAPYPGIPPRYYMLSNNHVLANSNQARLGDPILQPGPADGGQNPRDRIARLSRFVPIRFDGKCNYVDAAIAEGNFSDLDREIYWVGYPKKVRFITKPGEIVQKTGRTTHWTTGKITHVNATVNVNYGGGKVAKMCRQILTTNMSAGGDSGSCLLDMDGNPVGLLFAGSSQVTIHNQMAYVQLLLKIRVGLG